MKEGCGSTEPGVCSFFWVPTLKEAVPPHPRGSPPAPIPSQPHEAFTGTSCSPRWPGAQNGTTHPYLSWFYDRGAIKDPAIRGPIRKFLPNYANVIVTIQSHALSAGVQTHYVTANGVRKGHDVGPGYQALKTCGL